MKRILSERNFAVVLFVVALVVFGFAQRDTKKIEKLYMNPGVAASSIIPQLSQPVTENTAVKPATTFQVNQ